MQQSFYNQYDANRDVQRGFQSVLKQVASMSYYGMRFFINFVGSMIKMVIGGK
jgi:hypothetical protein